MKTDSSTTAMAFKPRSIGATVTPKGVLYTVWCTSQQSLTLEVCSEHGVLRYLTTLQDEEGYHCVLDPEGRAGDRYYYVFADGRTYPDPASRAQETHVRGRSVVVDSAAYSWHDDGWERPAFRDLVIYEIHIGTFTQEGTFRAAIDRLPLLKETGINAIELMPLADFPGKRGWGYDGVLLYAPCRTYGTPDDLRALVDAAHAQGIAVIQDAVYNHLGPDGNCLAEYSPQYFTPEIETPWGWSLNYSGPSSAHVRSFLLGNACYWLDEFHMDGLRLDATHWIQDRSENHLLREISRCVHERGGYVIAEDERNEALLIEPEERGGLGCDAVWADDYHHSVRVGQTGEKHSYLQDFSGTLEETVDTLQHGWLFRGQKHALLGSVPRGTPVAHVPPSRLIHCISNHDQTGNRAFGERLHSLISPASYRAISMLLCLTPYTPMLFMGQEWACSTPFQYFTDHHEDLGKMVSEGRRNEFHAFPEFNDPEKLATLPDPQSLSTYEQSKLNWEERADAQHASMLRLYKESLALRHSHACFRPERRTGWDALKVDSGLGVLRYEDGEHEWLLIFHLWPAEQPLDLAFDVLPWTCAPQSWVLVQSSNDTRFGGTGTHLTPDDKGYCFGPAECLLLKAQL